MKFQEAAYFEENALEKAIVSVEIKNWQLIQGEKPVKTKDLRWIKMKNQNQHLDPDPNKCGADNDSSCHHQDVDRECIRHSWIQ